MQKRQIDGSDSLSCAVLVLSCDRYRDLWQPFFKLFRRYWPDCDLPVYLGAESASFAGVCTLHSPVKGWSRSLEYYLQALDTRYVLLLLEDFFFDGAVRSADILQRLQELEALGGASLRLFPDPPPDYFDAGLGVLHHNADYRVSLQASIWNREQLLSLVVPDESPWEFEWKGSVRSRAMAAGFYCVHEAAIHYRHVVERGEWFRAAARYYAGQDIGCDFQARSTMGLFKTFRKATANFARRALNRLHSRWLCLTHPKDRRHAI
jgi:hypothetical protein